MTVGRQAGTHDGEQTVWGSAHTAWLFAACSGVQDPREHGAAGKAPRSLGVGRQLKCAPSPEVNNKLSMRHQQMFQTTACLLWAANRKFPPLSQTWLLLFLGSLFRHSVPTNTHGGKLVNVTIFYTALHNSKLCVFLECSKIQCRLGGSVTCAPRVLTSCRAVFTRIQILTSFVIRLRVSSGYSSIICSSLGNFSLASLECNFKAFNILSTTRAGYACNSTDSATTRDRREGTAVNTSTYINYKI